MPAWLLGLTVLGAVASAVTIGWAGLVVIRWRLRRDNDRGDGGVTSVAGETGPGVITGGAQVFQGPVNFGATPPPEVQTHANQESADNLPPHGRGAEDQSTGQGTAGAGDSDNATDMTERLIVLEERHVAVMERLTYLVESARRTPVQPDSHDEQGHHGQPEQGSDSNDPDAPAPPQ